MPRSDSAPPASDAQMRELARQLADSAPSAPAWDAISGHIVQRDAPPRSSSSVPKIALAFAAVVALVVGALWLGARGSDDEELPADVPAPSAPSTLPPLSQADQWAAFVATADPLDVQLCLARVSSNRVASGDLPALFVRSELLPAPSEATTALSLHKSSQDALAVLARSGLAAATSGSLGELADLYAGAVEAEYADGGLPASDFEERVAQFLSARSENTALIADPASCWLESPIGGAMLDELGLSPDGDLAVLRCLSVAQLDHALANVRGDAGPTMEQLAATSALGLTNWFLSGPITVDQVSRAVTDAALEVRLGDPETTASLRAQLDTATSELSCPLLRDESSSMSQPVDQQGAPTP